MDKYVLRCHDCGHEFQDPRNFGFECPENCNALIKTRYLSGIKFRENGVWGYIDWLPVESKNDYSHGTVFFRSESLADELGLKNLYYAFHGYFPDLGAHLETCTFKEIEVVVSLRYARECGVRGISVASVGNTANAFLRYGDLEELKIFLFVPSNVFDCVFTVRDIPENVVVVEVKGSYDDAREMAMKFSELTPYVYDGGGKNFARRDALATVIYGFYYKFRKTPDHYFQAVGSGTGAIAVYEGWERLRSVGEFRPPKIHVSQNEPFTPISDAWVRGERKVNPPGFDPLDVIYAKVLANRNPLYEISGGLYDALSKTGGKGYGVSNSEIRYALRFFRKTEGIDIYPAAGVAVYSLFRAIEEGNVESDSTILLNITGAGYSELKRELGIERVKPHYVVDGDLEGLVREFG